MRFIWMHIEREARNGKKFKNCNDVGIIEKREKSVETCVCLGYGSTSLLQKKSLLPFNNLFSGLMLPRYYHTILLFCYSNNIHMKIIPRNEIMFLDIYCYMWDEATGWWGKKWSGCWRWRDGTWLRLQWKKYNASTSSSKNKCYLKFTTFLALLLMWPEKSMVHNEEFYYLYVCYFFHKCGRSHFLFMCVYYAYVCEGKKRMIIVIRISSRQNWQVEVCCDYFSERLFLSFCSRLLRCTKYEPTKKKFLVAGYCYILLLLLYRLTLPHKK